MTTNTIITWKQWLIQAIARLKILKNNSAKFDAEILLCTVTKSTRSYLVVFSETLLNMTQYILLEQLLSRREQGEPIAYIIGECEFWSIKLCVSPVTIIPRSDTECLVERALDLSLPKYAQILDLGTGTGAISLALAYERPQWLITGIDLLTKVVALAHYNALNLGLKNVHFYKSDWFTSVKINHYNLIVTNPPYIKIDDPHLLLGDVRYEPHSALIAGKDGLKFFKKIIQEASRYLVSNGWLIVEHGSSQGYEVRKLFISAGFVNIMTSYDYSNLERITQGQWTSSFIHKYK